MLICPICNSGLIRSDNRGISCTQCMLTFIRDRGIFLLFWPNAWKEREDVTETVRSFYEQHPFPNYEEIDSGARLKQKAQQGVFARLLDEQIPHTAKVLEAGCGTGQLSNFLALTSRREIWATDISLNSLKLGHEFMLKNKIAGVQFLQMNLFKPVFRPASFDFVISSGVLHHTSDPGLAFQTIAKLVKPGGYIIIGLYNKYGRIWTDIKRAIFRFTGRWRKQFDNLKQRIWFADQYEHPHESKHTIGEVLSWFKQSGVEFINSIPKAEALKTFDEQENLFRKSPPGTWLDHLLVQLGMIFPGREGGFFVMIGRKKE